MSISRSDTGLPVAHRDRVLNFRQWCDLNGISKATGRRIIAAGEGPPVLQLSARRIGIRESDNAAWQASRAR
jgi:predicted DNA-binding transcriptional regulator AlpA